MNKVVLYVEGGGDHSETKARLRQGISQLLSNGLSLRNVTRRPKVVVCGSVGNTLKQFNSAVQTSPEATSSLLVDADAPVPSTRSATARIQEMHGWAKPSAASDEQIHLMVQTMEAWLVADRESLGAFYGDGYRESQLSAREDVESIPKQDLVHGLREATRSTKKGAYHKINHASQLLPRLNTETVCRKAPRFRKLIDFLADRLKRS